MLEVACGTGGLLVALAADGQDPVVGVDLSTTMLAQARKRLASIPAEVAARVELIQGDMRDLDLKRVFALAIVADNSFREVEDLDGMRQVLASLRRHLAPGGRLLVTERRFDPTRYPGGALDTGWSDPLSHPETGAEVCRRVRVRIDEGARRLRGVMTYRTTHADGREESEDCAFEGPILEPDDYHALFADAGLEAELYVGYEDRPDDGCDPTLCFVARPIQTT